MRRGHSLDGWETLFVGLAGGLLAHVAPALAAAALLAVMIRLFFANENDAQAHDLAPLAALGAIALLSMIWGAAATVGATLVWRVGVELVARRGSANALPLDWAAPVLVLLRIFDAPSLLVVIAACIAGLLWADWIIRRLADWRLDAPMAGAGAFLGAQGATLAPLLLFPTPQDALAAFVAMRLARALAWPALEPGYANAR